MTRSGRWLFLFFIIGISCSLQSPMITSVKKNDKEAFFELKQLLTQDGDWFFHREDKARLFYEERDRLGKRFKKELKTLLGDDIEAHYYAALFLSTDYYLQGRQPAKKLALSLYERGIRLIRKSRDEDIKGEEIKFSVFAALLSRDLGQDKKAVRFKANAEKLLKTGQHKGYFPAMSREDLEQYKAL